MIESRGSANFHEQRRVYQRYLVNLPAQCRQQGDHCLDVMIRDFCLGGMHLQIAAKGSAVAGLQLLPVAGDQIGIHFALSDNLPNKQIHLQARVVRADAKSLGVAFVKPDLADLQSVLEYSLQRSVTNDQPRAATSGENYQALIDGVRAKCDKPIKNLIDTFFLRQANEMTALAAQAHHVTEQNAYFETIDIFRRGEAAFKQRFTQLMRAKIASSPCAVLGEDTGRGMDFSADNLSLMEDDILDDWIAQADIANKSETVCHDELVGIEQRFSVLFGTKVEKENNPIGPVVFARVFQDALKSLNLGKAGYLASCKLFRDVLVGSLGSLYQDINNYLIQHNILPELHYQIKKAAASDQSKRPRKSREQALEELEKILPDDGRGEADDGANLYQLISQLQGIRDQHNSASQAATQIPHYSVDELQGKIAALKTSLPATAPGAPSSANLQSLALQLLNQMNQDPAGPALGVRESSIMETTGSIYDSMFNDQLISGGVKQWLAQVEMPWLQEAIKDDSVLADRSHIARRFLNHLAELEVYNNEQDLISNSVKGTIEKLLQQVSEQPGMDNDLVTSILGKVDALIKTQNKAYAENIQDVIKQCQAMPPQSESVATDVDEGALREWRKRIRRMKVGDWILFDADSSASSRLRLAWVSENFNQYVFVNLKGQLARAVAVDGLAALLASESALVLNDANEPAVDRAQYKMLQNLHEQLLHETTHDNLTGLINRREFEKQLKIQLVDANDIPEQNIICYLNLDYFDVINTTYGTEAGDQALVEVSQILANEVAGQGVLARVGGNEFAVLLLGWDVERAKTLIQQLRDAMSDYRFVWEDSRNAITFCSGIVPIDLQNQQLPRLLQTAEAACRLAKSKGVNCQQVIQREDDQLQQNTRIIHWATRIDDSMIDNTLQLRYQPIVSANDAALSHHAEILIGVSDGKGSLASPEHFILAAEKYRRMPEIDRWVMRNVLDYFEQHLDMFDKIGGIAINLSGLSLNDDSFISFIIEQLEASPLPNEKICFEVTETAGIENLSNAAQFIQEVKQTGCSFSLDDFGTGMSSYSYLKNLPVDYIKIDGSFVRDIESSKSDLAVVNSITEIGHFLDKQIIAECVEKQSTIDLLREIGVDYVQGYAIAKPMLLR